MATKDSKALEYNRMLKNGFFSLAAYTAKENGLDHEKLASGLLLAISLSLSL